MDAVTDHEVLTKSLYDLGERLLKKGDLVEAQLVFRQTFLILEETLGSNHPDVATALTRMAEIYKMQGRQREADMFELMVSKLREQLKQQPTPHNIEVTPEIASVAEDFALLNPLDTPELPCG